MSRKYHITQQDIHDVLLARGQKVSVSALVDFARSKNLLISRNQNRAVLARYIATIPFDNSDIELLYNLIEYDQRREKMTSSRIKRTISENSIRDAIIKFQEERINFNEVLSVISKPGSPTLLLEYDYDEEDFGKARMLQITRKKVRVEFCLNTSETIIRFPANNHCEHSIGNILKHINESLEEPFNVEKIDLSHISSPDQRNQFFDNLMRNMEGMELNDVTGIKFSRMDAPENDDDTDDEEEQAVPCFIKKAAFEGSSLLAQEEYQTFMKKGFFISNIKWKSVDNTSQELLKIEFEAGFSDQINCKNFKYEVKGIYSTEKESTTFKEKRRQASDPERIKYLALLEKSSETSNMSI
jgi:hypothetical protein